MSHFTILMYHMITAPTNNREARYACPPKRFAQHMQALSERDYSFVSFHQIEEFLSHGKPLPAKAIAVTLDDGFQDNYTYGFDILKKYRIPATIFLAVNKIGGLNDWMTSNNYPERLMLTWDQVVEMHDSGIHFGSHTLNHVKLDRIDEQTATAEIGESKRILESKLDHDIRWFAYPYGLLKPKTVNIIQANGYSLACSTRSGFNRQDIDPLLLRRIEVYGTDPVWKLLQKIKYGFNEARWNFPIKYYSSRLVSRIKGN